MRWPASAEYEREVYPALRQLFTTTDLFSFGAIGWSGLLKFNLQLFHNRAGVLAELLSERWGVTGYLHDLPEAPAWWINATCLETGKNWRFGKREMGDCNLAVTIARRFDLHRLPRRPQLSLMPLVRLRSIFQQKVGTKPIQQRANPSRDVNRRYKEFVYGMAEHTKILVWNPSSNRGGHSSDVTSLSAATPLVRCAHLNDLCSAH